MKEEPIECKVVSDELHFCTILKGDKEYAAARCYVRFPFASEGRHAFAVYCGEEKWVSTKEDCIRWLGERGLDEEQANELLQEATGNP